MGEKSWSRKWMFLCLAYQPTQLRAQHHEKERTVHCEPRKVKGSISMVSGRIDCSHNCKGNQNHKSNHGRLGTVSKLFLESHSHFKLLSPKPCTTCFDNSLWWMSSWKGKNSKMDGNACRFLSASGRQSGALTAWCYRVPGLQSQELRFMFSVPRPVSASRGMLCQVKMSPCFLASVIILEGTVNL